MDPNLNPNDNNGGALVATCIAFLVLTWFSVLIRFYTRIFITKSFQGDDWLMAVSQVIFTMSASFILAGVATGLGRHNKSLPQSKEIPALMWQALATATYIIDMMFIKLSIGVFLLRLAVQKRYRYTIWATMVIITIWSTALFFWNLFQCSPVQAQWDFTIPNLQCVSSEQIVAAAYALSVMTILSDWLFALLPIPMVWKVKMTTQAKVTVIAILGLGVFASIATLIRLKFLADLNDTADILFAGTDAMVWTLIEPGVAIVASSLVTIRPLLRQMRLKGFESTERSKSKSKRSATGGLAGSRSGHGNLTIGSAKDPQRSFPGHKPGDVTLIDLETGGETDSDPLTPGGIGSPPVPPKTDVARTTSPKPNALNIPQSRFNTSVNPGVPETRTSGDGAPEPTPHSEVFIIEGPKRHSHMAAMGGTNPLRSNPHHPQSGHRHNKSLPLDMEARSGRSISSRGSEDYAEGAETHSQSDGRPHTVQGHTTGNGSGEPAIVPRTLAARLSHRFSVGTPGSPRLKFLQEGGTPPIYSKFMGYRRTE